MGNIYFEQQKYPAAIKMYRMALDQVPLTSRSVRSKILRNIGVAFMRVGQYQVSTLCLYVQLSAYSLYHEWKARCCLLNIWLKSGFWLL